MEQGARSKETGRGARPAGLRVLDAAVAAALGARFEGAQNGALIKLLESNAPRQGAGPMREIKIGRAESLLTSAATGRGSGR